MYRLFLSSKYKSVNNQFSWLSHWKKMIIIYFIWTAVYLIRLIPGWFSMYAFIDYAIATLFSGSYYHLWYILSVIYAISLFIVCLKKLDKKYYMLVYYILVYYILVYYILVYYIMGNKSFIIWISSMVTTITNSNF